MAIEIRLLKDHEAESANSFFNRIYNTNRSLENFKWEFQRGPNGKAIYVIAVDKNEKEEKIVGIQCAIPLEMISSDGSTVLTAKSEDTLVDPAYRGQKLFERMYELLFAECRNAGVKHIWGFTPAVKAFQRLGFEIPFQTSQALLVFKPLEAYRYLARLNATNTFATKSKILALSFLSWVKGFARLAIKAPGHQLRSIVFDSKPDVRPEKNGNDTTFMLRQTKSYLKWRIADNPFENTYLNFQTTSGDSVTGDIIINHRKDVSYIEQMIFQNNVTRQQRKEIIRAVIAEMEAKDPALIRVLCFNNNLQMQEQITVLEEVGFTHLARGNYFVWKTLNEPAAVSVEKIMFSRLFTQGNT
jgi:GNAT superfamily N-acetyltransferase